MKRNCVILCLVLSLLALCAVSSAEQPEAETAGMPAEEEGLEEIQPLVEMSDVQPTDGMNLEELTEAFSGTAMSEYFDSATGFSMQYPSIFRFDEEKGSDSASTEDGKASITIENMLNEGKLTEEALLTAIRLEIPDAEPVKNEQNGCMRIDRISGDGTLFRSDMYLITEKSFHHIMMVFPAQEKGKYEPYIEYMINSMVTSGTDQG